METSSKGKQDLAKAIKFQKMLNPDSIFLPEKYDEAIKGVTNHENIVYDIIVLVNIYLEENAEMEEDFDMWEDFYDWGMENILNEYDHNNYGLNEIPPQFFNPIS
jgi:hypothetical protein